MLMNVTITCSMFCHNHHHYHHHSTRYLLADRKGLYVADSNLDVIIITVIIIIVLGRFFTRLQQAKMSSYILIGVHYQYKNSACQLKLLFYSLSLIRIFIGRTFNKLYMPFDEKKCKTVAYVKKRTQIKISDLRFILSR